ncbi:hypothetical protein AX15_000422 [Amanita polypyramis BW_CC]|nr:hypothetical protein AX15_000422 [Amanita polypyramis BW_CC]
MRVNEQTVLVGDKVVLVPYLQEHVPKYHSWMLDEQLRRLTASEPLSLEAEYKMQQKWLLDNDKLTFIILSKPEGFTMPSGQASCLPDPRIESLPMVGDVNLFLHGIPPLWGQSNQIQNDNDDDDFEAEVDIMIAESAYRRRGLAYEALQLMLSYATGTPELFRTTLSIPSPLQIPTSCLVTKITESNKPSIRLFEKLGFKVTKRVVAFGEVEMRWVATELYEQ